MKSKELIEWVNYYIRDASNDTVAPRRIARIQAHIALLKQIENTLKHDEKVTNDKLDKLLITDYMRNKLKKTIKKGTAPKAGLVDKLLKIHGLGNAKVKDLINKGLKDVNELHDEPYYSMLPLETRTWLQYKPISCIPRATIDKLNDKLKPLLKDYKWDIAGSYRRGKNFSGDVDVIIIGDLNNVIGKLKSLKPIVYAKGPDKISTLVKQGKNYLKMDIMRSEEEHYPYFLLYLTGSKENNIIMRRRAKAMNMLLNQRGLFKNGKETKGNFVRVENEEDIFKKLQIPYTKPEAR